jgi:signal transduction histidine kinase
MDLAKEVSLAVEEVSAAHPGTDVQLTTVGDLRGAWDSARLGQVFANLLGNAVQHGVVSAPITVSAVGEANQVTLKVHNRGKTISRTELNVLFSPFKRLKEGTAATTPTSSLGLGLYIADRIISAHGGTLGVQSTDAGGTEFTVHLPR